MTGTRATVLAAVLVGAVAALWWTVDRFERALTAAVDALSDRT